MANPGKPNKAPEPSYNVGDEVSYAMGSGIFYGTVVRIIGEGDSKAIEIEFEDGRKEMKRVRDRAVRLLRRATGKSEIEEKLRDRDRLKDPDIEAVRRSDVRKR